MKNKKIMFVTGSLSDGGAEKVMSILASGCAEIGADVTLIVLRDKKIIYSVSDKVKIVQFKDNGKFATFTRIVKLHKVLKRTNVEVVIPFLPIISLYTLLANIGVGKKIIMSERADPYAKLSKLPWKDKIGSFLMRRCGLYGLADWMVFQTIDAQSYYNKKIQNKSSIISNPLDTVNMPNPWNGEREKKIVAAGRFSEEKNFPMLLKAFVRFSKIHPEYKLIIYGEGKLRKEYENLITKLNINKIVELPGFSANLIEEIRKASMYISTSNHEGISNSMLEALGMGIPTIVTNCPIGGSKMFVRSDDNGILIPMNDEEALFKAMCKICEDTQYAVHISTNAIKIRNQISTKSVCNSWMEIINNL